MKKIKDNSEKLLASKDARIQDLTAKINSLKFEIRDLKKQNKHLSWQAKSGALATAMLKHALNGGS